MAAVITDRYRFSNGDTVVRSRGFFGGGVGKGWRLALCLAAAAGVIFSVASCREPPTARDRGTTARPIVAVTIFPVGDVTRVVAGPAADVAVILPAGASPATFEPAPDLVRRLAGARLVIAVGAGADGWGGDLARAWDAPLLVLTEGMALEYGDNPHVWLDPILVRDAIVPRVTDALITVAAAADAEPIRARAAEYRAFLTALDGEIRETLSAVESRAFVATHPAWPYFADRYDLRQVGVLYPAPGRELSPRELASLVNEARRTGVHAVFTEPQLGETGARALADELKARVGTFDPLGGPAIKGRDSYDALLWFNARELARTLGARHE
jgi:zinc transport system substrate-binding protein